MQLGFIITVVSDDKPGIVETLAQTVSSSRGSWLESRFSHLAGKFAGVFCVQIDAERRDQLETQLKALAEQEIYLQIVEQPNWQKNQAGGIHAQFSALGPDRQGIVKELSQAFLANGINIESMDTQVSSAPYSGERLFEARGSLRLPEGSEVDKLEHLLRQIADQLGMDFSLSLES